MYIYTLYNTITSEDEDNVRFQKFVCSTWLLKYFLSMSPLEKTQPYNFVGTNQDNMAVV